MSGRNLPSNGRIASWWLERERETGAVSPWGWQDWGEPSCWACGYCLEGWEISERARGNAAQRIVSVWNKTAGRLERCHVVPRALGGSDDPSNLVLMCGRCHELSPDTGDAAHLFRWMKQCPGSWLHVHWTAVEAMKAAADEVTGQPDYVEPTDEDISTAKSILSPSTHGGRWSPGTYATFVYEAARVAAERGRA